LLRFVASYFPGNLVVPCIAAKKQVLWIWDIPQLGFGITSAPPMETFGNSTLKAYPQELD
jgi:hypothetical protein